jgi:methylaspartate ammonia-lyase
MKLKLLKQFILNQEQIMATQAELAQSLTDLTTQVNKIGDESKATLQKVTDLETALANSASAGQVVSPEVQAAFDALKASVQAVDDLVPNP